MNVYCQYCLIILIAVTWSCEGSRDIESVEDCSEKIKSNFYLVDNNMRIDSVEIDFYRKPKEFIKKETFYTFELINNEHSGNRTYLKIADSLDVNYNYNVIIYGDSTKFENFISDIIYVKEPVAGGNICKVNSYILNEKVHNDYLNGFKIEL